MPIIDTDDLISVTEANTKGVSYLVTAAESGREHVILRNNRPAAVVIGIAHFEKLRQLEEELADVALLAARMTTTPPRRTSLDEILAEFGYTREQLADELADDE
jgi:prevent-host-death family protein